MIVGRWLERRNKRRYIFLHSTTVSGYSSIKYCNWAVASPDQYSFSLSLFSLSRFSLTRIDIFFLIPPRFFKMFLSSALSVCRRARFDCGYLQIRTEMSVTRSLLGRVSLYIYVNVKRLYVHFLSIQIRFVTNFLHPRIEYN